MPMVEPPCPCDAATRRVPTMRKFAVLVQAHAQPAPYDASLATRTVFPLTAAAIGCQPRHHHLSFEMEHNRCTQLHYSWCHPTAHRLVVIASRNGQLVPQEPLCEKYGKLVPVHRRSVCIIGRTQPPAATVGR